MNRIMNKSKRITVLVGAGAILDFDMTENVYVRGNRIYFMNSRNISDITFVWYDVPTGEVGPKKRICVSDFIN